MMDDRLAARLEGAELPNEGTKSLSREDELETGAAEAGPMMRLRRRCAAFVVVAATAPDAVPAETGLAADGASMIEERLAWLPRRSARIP